MTCTLNASYKLITEPTIEPLSAMNWIDTHLRLDTVGEDDLLEEYIRAARSYMEEMHSLMLITQTWEMNLDQFPCSGEIIIRRRPVQSVEWIKYYDQDNVLQTLDPANYQVDTSSFLARICSLTRSWPTAKTYRYNAVTVRFIGGYGSEPSRIKPCLLQALRLHVGHFYERREETADRAPEKIPMGYDSLVGSEKVVSV